ncbi:uncharacterized protein LOC110292492 [Mus caroli]|uniref:Uncharacterized protein LOC110292492 n=1 Tax=Mus caroli TaxID=10089 RepID=A0A6P5PJD4_MUSCR|nr:uncharacterized protein LOC110292492 [Mus caroli]
MLLLLREQDKMAPGGSHPEVNDNNIRFSAEVTLILSQAYEHVILPTGRVRAIFVEGKPNPPRVGPSCVGSPCHTRHIFICTASTKLNLTFRYNGRYLVNFRQETLEEQMRSKNQFRFGKDAESLYLFQTTEGPASQTLPTWNSLCQARVAEPEF